MAGDSEACSVQDCEAVLCFRDVGKVAGADWVALPEDALGATEEEAEKRGVEHGREEGRDGELVELHF